MTPPLSVVLPYYNEERFLPVVLSCALEQSVPPHQVVLVDNGSTDGSRRVCERLLAGAPFEVVHVTQPTPGKIAALQAGCARVTGDVIVFWDADTRYPPGYLQACGAAFARFGPDTVAVFATPLRSDPDGWRARWVRWSYQARARLWPRQVLTGGYGHAVRTETFRRCGGFAVERWPYVLLDHEIMHQLFKHGRGRYDGRVWCQPSERRGDRRSVRWSLAERVVYHLTPYRWKDWYFYRFLGPRLRRRGLSHLNLRQQPWRVPASSPAGGQPSPGSSQRAPP